MKLIKIYYRVSNDGTHECLDDCPFGMPALLGVRRCGSCSCQECKHCYGHGKEPIWILGKERGLNFGQGYIYCNKCVVKPTLRMRLMRLIYIIKLKLWEINLK